MSDLGFNKIAFCLLGTGLILIGVNEGSHAFFHSAHHEKDGYFIDVPEAAGEGPAVQEVEGPRDYLTLITNADVAAGEAVALKCKQCHSFEPGGEVITGPPLFGVMGRNVASLPGFKYTTGSGSLSEIGGIWDYEKFDHYIERPKAMAPATAMNFIGLKKEADRINLMAWLRTLESGQPYPLPAPLPPQEASATGEATDGATPAEDAAAPEAPAEQPAPEQH